MGGTIALGVVTAGKAGTPGSGTAAEVPSTGTGLQASFAGNAPSSSRTPEVIVMQPDRLSSAEALAT
ncbi:MAG: hypothetical protein ACRDQV_12105, partial [Pseudonocardiaceae bacterium]